MSLLLGEINQLLICKSKIYNRNVCKKKNCVSLIYESPEFLGDRIHILTENTIIYFKCIQIWFLWKEISSFQMYFPSKLSFICSYVFLFQDIQFVQIHSHIPMKAKLCFHIYFQSEIYSIALNILPLKPYIVFYIFSIPFALTIW